MNWFGRIREQCTGNGAWQPCMTLVHQRRDEVYRRAEKAAEQLGHTLGKWSQTHTNYCRRCGHNVQAHNIMAPSDGPDFSGIALAIKCSCRLNNERFAPEDKLEDINKPAKITVAGNWFKRIVNAGASKHAEN